MTHWYAVYTQPRNETLACEHLARQGFEVYFPRFLKRRSHARRVDVAPAPLFPRYMFVAFDETAGGWRVIRSTRGVVDLVRNGLHPVPVPQAVIETIRSREDGDGYVVLARHLELGRGDRIRIDSGPFVNCDAIFEAKRDDRRVVALLALLGREVVVDLPIRAVAPVN
jgi:transcriptional antiterminator RfaH